MVAMLAQARVLEDLWNVGERAFKTPLALFYVLPGLELERRNDYILTVLAPDSGLDFLVSSDCIVLKDAILICSFWMSSSTLHYKPAPSPANIQFT